MLRKSIAEILRQWPERPESLTVSRELWEAMLAEIQEEGVYPLEGIVHIKVADTLMIPRETLAD